MFTKLNAESFKDFYNICLNLNIIQKLDPFTDFVISGGIESGEKPDLHIIGDVKDWQFISFKFSALNPIEAFKNNHYINIKITFKHKKYNLFESFTSRLKDSEASYNLIVRSDRYTYILSFNIFFSDISSSPDLLAFIPAKALSELSFSIKFAIAKKKLLLHKNIEKFILGKIMESKIEKYRKFLMNKILPNGDNLYNKIVEFRNDINFNCDYCNKQIKDGLAIGTNIIIISIYCKDCIRNQIKNIITEPETEILFIGDAIAFIIAYHQKFANRYLYGTFNTTGAWKAYADKCNMMMIPVNVLTDLYTDLLVDKMYKILEILEK